MKVLGVRVLNFTDEKGNQIQGVNVYVSFPEDNVQGEMTDKLFLSLNKFESICEVIKPGDEIEVTYNRFGKISKVELF